MVFRIIIAVVGVLAAVAALGLVKGAQIQKMVEASKQAGPPPESVAIAEANEQVWVPALRAVGTVRAVRGVTVSTEVPGLVSKLFFDSGRKVEAGAILLKLDSSIEQAQLRSAKATANLAAVTLRRAERLAAEKINAPAELDTAKAEADQAVAQVANIEAQIAKKTIRAPFAGQLGLRQVDLGQILAAGAPIVSLQDLQRVYVDFYLPQQDLPAVAVDQIVRVHVDAAPDRVWTGRVHSIEPSVEAATRNVQVRAQFDNPDGALHPGMFVEVRVELPPGPPVVVIPATAVVYAPYGNSVYVVEDAPPAETEVLETSAGEGGSANGSGPETAAPDAMSQGPAKVARQVFVKLGERRGDFVSVLSGLTEGQQVVSAGAFKLRNGARVVVAPGEAIKPELAPTPKDS